jgi:hypothetical protein
VASAQLRLGPDAIATALDRPLAPLMIDELLPRQGDELNPQVVPVFEPGKVPPARGGESS